MAVVCHSPNTGDDSGLESADVIQAVSVLVKGLSDSIMHLHKLHAPVCSCLSKDATQNRKCHDYTCLLDNSHVCLMGS